MLIISRPPAEGVLLVDVSEICVGQRDERAATEASRQAVVRGDDHQFMLRDRQFARDTLQELCRIGHKQQRRHADERDADRDEPNPRARGSKSPVADLWRTVLSSSTKCNPLR